MPHSISSDGNVEPVENKPCKKDELELNRLISTLTNAYDGYAQIEQRIETKNDSKNETLDLDDYEDNDGNKQDDELKNLNETRSEMYQKFINSFDELTMYVRNFKINNLQWFKNNFQISKLSIIQLYEFINKLLKLTAVADSFSFNFKGEMINNLQSKAIIVKVALEFLHILTTSKSNTFLNQKIF